MSSMANSCCLVKQGSQPRNLALSCCCHVIGRRCDGRQTAHCSYQTEPQSAVREPSSSTESHAGQAGPAAGVASRWYVCYTRSRAEKRVERLLVERDFEAYLPTCKKKRKWADRTRLVTFPLFPSYVFSRFELRQVHYVLAVPGISSVVRLNGRLTPIPDAEIENIRRLAAALSDHRHEPELLPFQEGDPVRVTDGPFRGVEGVVLQRRRRTTVLVGLRVIRQGISLRVEARHLELLTPKLPRSRGQMPGSVRRVARRG